MRKLFATLAFLLGCLAFELGVSGIMAQDTAAQSDFAPWESWETKLSADHPLVGRIWSRAAQDFISPDRLARALGDGDFLLLGEVHDNPDHHRLQAWAITQVTKTGRRPAVVMEQIRLNQAKTLADYLARPEATPEGLGAALDWDKSGWPPWRIYEPIARAAMAAQLPLAPGDAPRDEVRKIGKTGWSALPPARVKTLRLDTPLPPALDKALLAELVKSHCDLMPASALKPMARAQRYRDALLADSMLTNATRDGVILITGNGHARTDRGVPWYLRRRIVGAKILTLAIVEAHDDGKTVADLSPKDPEGKIAADFVWITPRAEREDPCEGLRKRFGKGAKTSPKETGKNR